MDSVTINDLRRSRVWRITWRSKKNQAKNRFSLPLNTKLRKVNTTHRCNATDQPTNGPGVMANIMIWQLTALGRPTGWTTTRDQGPSTGRRWQVCELDCVARWGTHHAPLSPPDGRRSLLGIKWKKVEIRRSFYLFTKCTNKSHHDGWMDGWMEQHAVVRTWLGCHKKEKKIANPDGGHWRLVAGRGFQDEVAPWVPSKIDAERYVR